jgi:site-specific DNA-methyltransferase (adenine-specific)
MENTIKLHNADCLQVMKSLPDNSVDIIFTDPPYALGSEVIIRPDGKPDYKKAVDFMSKWQMPNGDFWNEWFFEANRILKFGGHCLMFGIDRQTFLFQYYAILNKFTEKQKLYWYTIQSFPKATDLQKVIQKQIESELSKQGFENIIWED